jgi:methionyl-tRNA formyltransferase
VKDRLTIIFMGTPEFAVPHLEALHASPHRVLMVITQPDRPKGRGQKLTSSPVKRKALSLGYSLLQPQSMKTEDIAGTLTRCQADLFVVVAFGLLLPKTLLNIPPMGAVNVHASLLPRYRGPAPIQWAIINGEAETGITTMQMDPGLDTGPILLRANTPILPDDTLSSLHDRLAQIGADLLIKTLDALSRGDIRPVPQDHTAATYAPRLKKEDGHINWAGSSESIGRLIRAMNPWPGAFSFCDGKRLKIYKATPIHQPVSAPPGTVIQGFADELRVATGEGALNIEEIQEESGKRLPTKTFLCGWKISPGAQLS